jgi:glyoxylase-like metal-dependent hydrolase (beta-lactamase superfamily II)
MRISRIRRFLGTLAAVWIVTGASADAQAPGGRAGAPAAPAQAEPDLSKVEIKTAKISSNFYTLQGQGATIGALVGPDGVFLVDGNEFSQLTEKLAAALRQISNGRIRFLVNTHLHRDHTGANEGWAKMGAVILARDELRTRLAQKNLSAGPVPEWRPPAPPAALPMVTYRGPVTVHMNGEEVQLIHVPFAHTDGDTMVRFPVADVLMTGDFFRSAGYPNIDLNNGGTLEGMLEALNAAINASGGNTKVIPGHGPVMDRAGLIANRDMFMGVRDRVAQLIREGKTAEQTVAAKPTADYDARVPGATASTADRFVRQLYTDLKGTR